MKLTGGSLADPHDSERPLVGKAAATRSGRSWGIVGKKDILTVQNHKLNDNISLKKTL